MSQKSRFKMQSQGIHKFRRTFPQLPWNVVKNPTFIQTAHGYVVWSYFALSRHINRLLNIAIACWQVGGGRTLENPWVYSSFSISSSHLYHHRITWRTGSWAWLGLRVLVPQLSFRSFIPHFLSPCLFIAWDGTLSGQFWIFDPLF